MDLFSHFHFKDQWEKRVLKELYLEYRDSVQSHRVKMRPAAIELVDSEVHWGRWISQTRTIQISRQVIQKYSWFHVVAILRHEMAHQLVEESGNSSSEGPHGEKFQWACRKLGVPSEFSGSKINLQEHTLDWRELKRDEEAERMLEKVRKLMALAGSSDEHEAVLAMNRVREIYAKYNLARAATESKYFHIVIPRKTKRMEAHERMIVGLLVGHFFVQTVTGAMFDSETGEYIKKIEIIGTKENVLMAEYVYHFLMRHTDMLADQAVKAMKGPRSRYTRKSFRLGILEGFQEKLRLSERQAKTSETTETSVISKALVAFENDKGLDKYVRSVFPRLSTVRTGRNVVEDSAYAAGISAGRNINLNRPMEGSSTNTGRLLGRR